MFKLRLLLAAALLAAPAACFAQVRVAITIEPPALPVYEQPLCPGDGYLWTPGYWAYDDGFADYYWVPGTWVMAPEVGFLWTPGYWGWGDGGYVWYDGFWGPTVGFYGGIDYGFGYFGVGFGGGRWENGHFFYNRSVSHVDETVIHNVYNTTIVDRNTTRVSYNGGQGGVHARPSPEEEAAAHERHLAPVAAQQDQARAARSNPGLRASANHGNPPIAATARAGEFGGHGMPARGAEEAGRGGAATGGGETRAPVHPKDLPPLAHTPPADSGSSKADKKYEKEQEKMIAKQQQERDKLQAKQDAEHKKKMNSEQAQKLEQKHQQQTQQLAQRHAAEQQSLQARQPEPAEGRPRK